MPISLQYQNLKDYIVTKTQNSYNEISKTDDSDDQMVGKITKRERREKVQRYLEKKKKRNWKSIRYEVRKDLAEKR